MHFLLLFLLSTLLAACASTPSDTALHAVPAEPTQHFFDCFDESKRTWLVSLVGSKDPGGALSESLIPDYVGSSPSDQTRARGYLNGLKLKQYASREAMAGAQFNACMGRVSAENFEPIRSIRCFDEQRLIFELTALRLVKQASLADATQYLVKANPSANGSAEIIIKRLAKDTYTIMKPGEESTFSVAQFQVCMTSHP